MAYDRYLDIHFFDSWTKATFSKDVGAQKAHQEGKVDEYKIMEVDTLAIRRGVTNDYYRGLITWICGGANSKIRINAHGGSGKLFDGKDYGVELDKFADFLRGNGLTPENAGGLKTVNLAACAGAEGAQSKWLIKVLADHLKLPGVAFTGAPTSTRMENGVLHVKVVQPNPPGKYVPPGKRPVVSEPFKKHATHKKTYTYTA
jgi:hypothetical protein